VELDLSGIDIAFSGCTFIALVLYENNLYSINIGDSRAILCQGLTVVELTIMHKPDHPL
jgi:serine/threonine protein phosphatase PrpC